MLRPVGDFFPDWRSVLTLLIGSQEGHLAYRNTGSSYHKCPSALFIHRRLFYQKLKTYLTVQGIST